MAGQFTNGADWALKDEVVGKLLREYRAALLKAFDLGSKIKEQDGYNPPKIIIRHEDNLGFSGTVGLDVNGFNMGKEKR